MNSPTLPARSMFSVIHLAAKLGWRLLTMYPLIFLGYGFIVTLLHWPAIHGSLEDSSWGYVRLYANLFLQTALSAWMLWAGYMMQQNPHTPPVMNYKLLQDRALALLIATLVFSLIVFLIAKVFALFGIFVGVALMFYVPIILFESPQALSALIQSVRLVWGNWLRTVLLFFIIFVLPLSFWGTLVPRISWLFVICNTLALTILIPFGIAVWLYWYQDLKRYAAFLAQAKPVKRKNLAKKAKIS